MRVVSQGKERRGGFAGAASDIVSGIVISQDVVVFVIRLDTVGRLQARSQDYFLPGEEQGQGEFSRL